MMVSLVRLLSVAPSWVDARVTGPGIVDLKVCPPRASGTPVPGFDLVLRMDRGGGISIAEQQPGSGLPACCLERHINTDGTFCIHLDSTDAVRSREAAGAWWESLRAFLIAQDYASRHRVWPLHSQLSHGTAAAKVQIEMEERADPLGWMEEVHLGIFRQEGWLGSGLPHVRVCNGQVGPVPNVRTPCPRGCRMNGRRPPCQDRPTSADAFSDTHPILKADCPNRSALETLIRLEHRRRYLEGEVMEELRKDGVVCCGTMAHCALSQMDKKTVKRLATQ